MPIYEYKCMDCKKTFAVRQTLKEFENASGPKCEHCGSSNVERRFSGLSVITSKKS